VTISDASNGSMEIVDNGSGMSRADLENGFMRLASDEKVRNPVSRKYGRARAGKKGIGPFATERLGAMLTIITQTEEEDRAWKVTIDWTAFEQGQDIGLVPNTINQVAKERPHGTRPLIEDLNDGWTEAEIRRVPEAFWIICTLICNCFEGSGCPKSRAYRDLPPPQALSRNQARRATRSTQWKSPKRDMDHVSACQ